jgi:hypothetical protein
MKQETISNNLQNNDHNNDILEDDFDFEKDILEFEESNKFNKNKNNKNNNTSHENNNVNQDLTNNENKNNAWIMQTDTYGRDYYFNTLTNESSWYPPDYDSTINNNNNDDLHNNNDHNNNNNLVDTSGVFNQSTLSSVEVRQGDWIQRFDEYGNEYWLNEVNGETSWEAPGEIESLQFINDLSMVIDYNTSLSQGQNNQKYKQKQQGGSHYSGNDSYSASAGGYVIEL